MRKSSVHGYMRQNLRKTIVSKVYPPQLDPNFIDPDFFQTYVSAVCQSAMSYDVQACIRNMDVPLPEVQQNIMNSIRNLSRDVDIHEILGPVMVLLIKGRLEDVVELVNLYQMYQGIYESIREIVMATLEDVHALEPMSILDV